MSLKHQKASLLAEVLLNTAGAPPIATTISVKFWRVIESKFWQNLEFGKLIVETLGHMQTIEKLCCFHTLAFYSKFEWCFTQGKCHVNIIKCAKWSSMSVCFTAAQSKKIKLLAVLLHFYIISRAPWVQRSISIYYRKPNAILTNLL
jgi:hypothetical protein